ncbi:MAG: TraR/DksA family transcriptional regulator [Candidatus Methylacidiphilales bacterium]|nr:TraR/DksA C4-type zinc finger protein [Candidatus Methylacidiphilales bacterium]
MPEKPKKLTSSKVPPGPKLPKPPVGKPVGPAALREQAKNVRSELDDISPIDFFARQKARLLDMRDAMLDQMQGVAKDSLRAKGESSAVGLHQADAGSDAYEHDFALTLLSQEQDALYEIEEALKRLEGGTYGICEMSGKEIPRTRLDANPFARFTIDCQKQLEKENRGRRRWESGPQFMDANDSFSEEEEDSSDDEDRKNKDRD